MKRTKPKILNVKLVVLTVILFLIGCGAYFNTFYNTKKFFNTAENKRQEKQKEKSELGENTLEHRTYRIPEYKKAIEKASKVLQLYPNSKYVDDALMIIGQSFYYTGDYIKAQRKFEELIEFFPDGEFAPKAQLWLGKTLIALNNYSEAKNVLNQLLIKNVDKHLTGEAQMLLGELYYAQENYDAAIEQYINTVNKVDGKDEKIKAQMRAGQCYIELGDYEKAARMFRKALDFNPGLEQEFIVKLNYGEALSQLLNYKAALNVFEGILEGAITDDEMATVRMKIAETLINMGEIEKAQIALEDIIHEYPKTDHASKAYYVLGNLYMNKKGDFDKAKKQFELALKEFRRSSIRDSIRFWSNNLKEWDKLQFESSVFKNAYKNLGTISGDTTGDYIVKESPNPEDQFNFPDFFADQDSAKKSSADSLNKLTASDSVKTDSMKNQPNFTNNRSQKQEEIDNRRNRQVRNFNLNNRLNNDSQDNKQAEQRKEFKKVVVPKSPTKLKDKLITTTNRMADLYLFQLNVPDSALLQYQFLMKSFPDNKLYPHWLFSSAYLYEQNGHSDEADSLYRLILDRFPNSEFSVQARKKLDMDSKDNVVDPAKQLFLKAESYLLDKGMTDSSISIYKKVIEHYPNSEFVPKALFNIGYIYDWYKHDTSKAISYYRKLESEYPDSEYGKKCSEKITAVKQAKIQEKQELQKEAQPDSIQQANQSGSKQDAKAKKKGLPPDFVEDPLKPKKKKKGNSDNKGEEPQIKSMKKTNEPPDSLKSKEKKIPPKSKKGER